MFANEDSELSVSKKKTRFCPAWFLLLSGLISAACGSSESDGSSQSTVFADPVDAPTLRQALITGSTPTDTANYWLCSISDDGRSLEYRLFPDSSGTELSSSNPGLISAFTWQATSATTMVTTVTGSGLTNSFTDIRFTDRDSMSLRIGDLSISCSRKSSEPSSVEPQPAANSLSYLGRSYTLSHGFITQSFNQRYAFEEIAVADKEYQPYFLDSHPYTVHFPYGASIELSAILRRPARTDYQSATFVFTEDLETANSSFTIVRGGVAVDTNGDGDFQDNEQGLKITSGTMTVQVLENDFTRVDFNFTLSDGAQATGSFTGLFPVYTVP